MREQGLYELAQDRYRWEEFKRGNETSRAIK